MDISITLNFSKEKEEVILEQIQQILKIANKQSESNSLTTNQIKAVEEVPEKHTTIEKPTFETISQLLRKILVTHKNEVFARLETYGVNTVKDLSEDQLKDFYIFLVEIEKANMGTFKL